MKKLCSLFLLCTAVIFASCSKDDPTPGLTDVAFNNLAVDGGEEATTLVLKLTFDKAIEGLSTEDITLEAGATGAVKGILTDKGDGVYELSVSGITTEGEVIVSVAKTGYKITPASKGVVVQYVKPLHNVTFNSLTAAAGEGKITVLTLTFSEEIKDLTMEDIRFEAGETGAVKEALTAKGGGLYELTLNGVTTGGEVKISVSKAGYEITPDLKTVTVSPNGPAGIAFSDLTANGASLTFTTTKLTLTFDEAVTGLTAEDITLSEGITKGMVTDKGYGVYELTVSGVKAEGSVTVTVSKTGYMFTPASRDVAVFHKPAGNIVGNYFYSDGTHSGDKDPEKTVVGIVFWQDPNDPEHGKIVSLIEKEETAWSTEIVVLGADSDTDGVANTNLVKNVSGYETKYPVVAWCAALTDGGREWYIPAYDELEALYEAWRADSDAFDAILTGGGGVVMTQGEPWSSTERGSDGMDCIRFSCGTNMGIYKGYKKPARAIAAF